jgi:hypothetical protein
MRHEMKLLPCNPSAPLASQGKAFAGEAGAVK